MLHPPPVRRAAAWLGAASVLLGIARPATGALPPVDSVVGFSEVMYHPSDDDSGGEFLEIHNLMGVDVDLSGWSITGGINFTFPTGTVIQGGEYLAVAADPDAIPGALGPFAGALNNGGETLRLRDRNRRLMDEVSYEDEGDWPVAADGSGASLAKNAPSVATPLPGSWTISSQIGGTPGQENFPPPPATVSGRVIEFHSEWRHFGTGGSPGADWTTAGFDDAASGWQAGTAAFDFGETAVYGEAAGAAFEVAGVTVSDVSSEAAGAGLDRAAAHAVDGSGLSGNGHGTSPDGTMWLTRGNLLSPPDPLPAHIVFDLGSPRSLTSLRIWNYNENATSDQTSRGARDVEIRVASAPWDAFVSAGTFEFARASGSPGDPGQEVEFPHENVRFVRFDISSNWGAANGFAGLSEVKFFSDTAVDPPPPPPYRAAIAEFRASGEGGDGKLLDPGDSDPHYKVLATGQPAIVQTGHRAWLAPDGLSHWIGPTASGAEDVAPGTSEYRLDVDLTFWKPSTAEVRMFASVDNSLDRVRVNGSTAPGVGAAGFGGYLGPFELPNGLLNQGPNTIDFEWTNTGDSPNPAGIRIRWEASAEPILARTALPGNPAARYFRQSFVWNGNPASTYSLRLEHLLDDGAVFYLNGAEILRVNMPDGPAGPSTLAAAETLYPQFSGPIELPGDAFVAGENVLAVELHQAAVADSDAIFAATLDVSETPPVPAAPPAVRFSEAAGSQSAAGGFFVELVNEGSAPLNLGGYFVRSSSGAEFTLAPDTRLPAGGQLALHEADLGFRPDNGERLFLIAAGGLAAIDGLEVKRRDRARGPDGTWLVPSAATPGAPNSFAIPDSIVVSEIMYHRASAYHATGTTENPEEWIELFNRGSAAVDLGGWELRGGADFAFAAGTVIDPGEYLVVARDSSALAALHPGIAVVGNWSESLSNGGDEIRLEDPNGNPADVVSYLDGGRWDSRADGGGSSLELRHPDMDNAHPEAWSASDESSRAQWQTFSYTGTGAPPAGSSDPTLYHELVLGLLGPGECMIDDVSVIDHAGGGAELIQNGDFSGGTASAWRLLGNHGGHGLSRIMSESSNPALRIVATGAAEHMHNHCETTLKNGGSYATLQSGRTYTVSFRAKWLSGMPRLHSRLYFNRLARQSILPMPAKSGTPGAPNSSAISLPAPVLSDLAHSPVIPAADEDAAVEVAVSPAVPAQSVVLHWRQDGAGSWQQSAMTQMGADPSGAATYSGSIPAREAGALVHFYVSALSADGGAAAIPAGGADSRALIRWQDAFAPPGPGHGLRILLPAADTDFLHSPTNVMSNDFMPCTVVYRESEVFYDAAVRLRSSQRGRLGNTRLGFAISFDPTHRFRGVHEVVNLDRSAYGPGTTGSGFGQVDIINQQFALRAGGIPAMHNDLVYLIAPRSAHNGSAQLTMAEFNDIYLDSQWDDGADSPTFKFDLIYYPLTTTGGPEGLKIAQPDRVTGVQIGALKGTSKEDYRWHFLIGNDRKNDDYSRIIAFNRAFDALASGNTSLIADAIDIDQWLRASAAMSLVNSNDSYATGGLPHNLKLYVRPQDGRVLYFPWDQDFHKQPTNFAVAGNPDLQRIINADPAHRRAFYGHLHDIIRASYNVDYLSSWVDHFEDFSTAGGDWDEILSYVSERSAFVLAQCQSLYPQTSFRITSNGGNGFAASEPFVMLSGAGWIDVREIRLQGSPNPIAVTWTGSSAWKITVPVAPGPNQMTLQAFNYQGEPVGSDSITITGTGSIAPASAENIVVSELHYHPSDPDAAEIAAGFTDAEDFEFIELLNISASDVDLTGCRFVSGIDYSAAAGVTLPPGGFLVIPRRAAAFAMRYPGVPAGAEYFVDGANFLRNSGEEIALLDAAGHHIKQFEFGDSDPWPEDADGRGASLVLIAPAANPNHADPLSWRPGAASPGTSDALAPPANPNADDNLDGVSNLMNYAAGGRPEVTIDPATRTVTFVRESRADVVIRIEATADLTTWIPADVDKVSRAPLDGSRERLALTLTLNALQEGASFRAVRFVIALP